MTTMKTFYHILDINAPKNKAEAFQKVCDLMFVDVASKKHCLKGKLDFSRIAPDFDIPSVTCTINIYPLFPTVNRRRKGVFVCTFLMRFKSTVLIVR